MWHRLASQRPRALAYSVHRQNFSLLFPRVGQVVGGAIQYVALSFASYSSSRKCAKGPSLHHFITQRQTYDNILVCLTNTTCGSPIIQYKLLFYSKKQSISSGRDQRRRRFPRLRDLVETRRGTNPLSQMRRCSAQASVYCLKCTVLGSPASKDYTGQISWRSGNHPYTLFPTLAAQG